MPKSIEKKEKITKNPQIKAKFIITGCSSENSSEYVNQLTRCLTQLKTSPQFDFDYNILVIPYDQ